MAVFINFRELTKGGVVNPESQGFRIVAILDERDIKEEIIDEWIDENIGGLWSKWRFNHDMTPEGKRVNIYGISYGFNDMNDYVAFKLRWE